MMNEDTVTLPTHLLAPMNEEADLLDSQFDKGWDAGVQAAFEIIEQELGRTGNEYMLARLKSRFMRELEMKED
jgi:hypothetical protein